VFAKGRLLELYIWNKRPSMSVSNLDAVSNAMQRVSKALAEAAHLKIIVKYWNTSMQANNI
jgi:hypothetical protein